MSRRSALWSAVGTLALAGCGAGVDESDQAAVRREFSDESYESAMRTLGREGEWRSEQTAAVRRAEEEGRTPPDGGDPVENPSGGKTGNPEEHRAP